METKFFISKNLTLKVEKNDDGALCLTDYNDGKPYINVGTLINCNGSREQFFARCLDAEEFQRRMEQRRYQQSPEYRKEQARKQAERNVIAAAQHKAAFDALPSPIPVTYENIGIALKYLRDQPYGCVQLPSMTVGYSFNQYDCDGHLAAAMILDEDLIEDGENLGRRFVVGAPLGHLTNYKRCR